MKEQAGLVIKTLFRDYKKAFVFVYIAYMIGLAGIMLANYTYNDDLYRQASGFKDWGDSWNRPLSDFLSSIIHVDNGFLLVISPYNLFISAFFLSLSSIILVNLICNPNTHRLSKSYYFTLLASLPIGLSPYFLQSLSYKFDSIYMTLALFLQILPFLFIAHKRIFVIITIISIVCSYSLYQASSGIFVIIAIFLVFRNILSAMPLKQNLGFVLMFLVPYLLGCMIYKIFIYMPLYAEYARAVIAPFDSLALVSMTNITTYLTFIYNDLGGMVLFKLIVCLCIMFIAKAVSQAKCNKIFALFVSIITLCMMLVLSYGAYILLVKPIFAPRAFSGFGVFVGLVAIYAMNFQSKFLSIISGIFALMMAESLIVFANYYGNVLSLQKEYEIIKTSLILQDINHYAKSDDKITIKAFYENNTTPAIRNAVKYYPLIGRLIVPDFQRMFWHITNNSFDAEWLEASCGIVHYERNGEVILDTNFYMITRFQPRDDDLSEIPSKDSPPSQDTAKDSKKSQKKICYNIIVK